MRKLLIANLATLLCFGGSLIAQAADKPADKAAEGKKEAKSKFRPFNGTIKSVDKTAKTITLEGEKAQAFQITSETKIVKDGKPAILDELSAGDKIGGRARETSDGKWEALTINAGKKAVKSAGREEKKPDAK